MDDTSKHAKFQVDGFSTFGDMTSQKFPFHNGTSHRDSIFTSLMYGQSRKPQKKVGLDFFSSYYLLKSYFGTCLSSVSCVCL